MSTEVALHYAYQWEKQRPNDIWFVQPTGGGKVKELSFKQAMAYIAWRNENSPHEWRLLNEFEWEKAGRGVDARIFPWGSFFSPAWCNMDQSKQEAAPCSIHEYPIDVSVYGISGMAGNLSEWTSSAWVLQPDLPPYGRVVARCSEAPRATPFGGDARTLSSSSVGSAFSLRTDCPLARAWSAVTASSWRSLARSYASRRTSSSCLYLASSAIASGRTRPRSPSAAQQLNPLSYQLNPRMNLAGYSRQKGNLKAINLFLKTLKLLLLHTSRRSKLLFAIRIALCPS